MLPKIKSVLVSIFMCIFTDLSYSRCVGCLNQVQIVKDILVVLIIIIITDLYSAFRSNLHVCCIWFNRRMVTSVVTLCNAVVETDQKSIVNID